MQGCWDDLGDAFRYDTYKKKKKSPHAPPSRITKYTAKQGSDLRRSLSYGEEAKLRGSEG